MDVLRPLDDSDSVFLLLTKRLNLLKFHELLNKIQEFMAGLREEDLTDGTLKELTVKRDATGRQTVLLNYNPVPQPQPTQVQAQPPVQTQPQPQPQLQPQQQVQQQLQPPLQAQVQPAVQQQVQVQAQPQPQVQTQTQPQLPIQQQQLPKLQQTQPQIQPQIQINHPQKQVPEPYYQPQTIQYEGPQPVKKVKMDQLAHSETNNQQAATPMDNGGYNQQKHNAMKPELPRTTYSEYEEYDQAKDTWRISGQQSSHGNMNLSNFSSSFRGGQSYPSLNAMSTISSMSTMSSLNTLSTMTADIQQPRTKSINYYQEDSMPSHPSDTPKFPNQHTLAAYVEKIWKENPTLQENNDIVERNDKSHNFNPKSYPVFESSFVKIDPPNFYIDAVKPGLVSKKLSQALGMASEKEAPPYLSKLLKVGLPGTYREETFYGINARVPKDFDKESWLKAGVSPTMFETEKTDVVAQQDVQNKNKGKEGEAHIPGVLSDTDYLDRFLRKPQTFYGKTGAPLKTIEIDD